MDNLAANLLRKARVEVSPGTYSIISLAHPEWHRILSMPEISPSMIEPFGILYDKFEVTLMLSQEDFARLKPSIKGAKIERNFRLITFDIKLDFSIVGFLAEITRILAQAEIPIFVLSAFARDHILVKQANLAPTLKALGPYVSEVC